MSKKLLILGAGGYGHRAGRHDEQQRQQQGKHILLHVW